MLQSTRRDIAQARRQALAKALGPCLVLLRSAGVPKRGYQYQSEQFRQNSTLLYFTGVGVPKCDVVIDCFADGRLHLFLPEMSKDELVWHDREPKHIEWQEATGAATVRKPEDLPEFLKHRSDQRLLVLSDNDWPGLKASDELLTAVINQRLRKTTEELDEMRRAMVVTRRAHRLAMAVTRPGLTERDVQAAVEAVFRSSGSYAAYSPIATCRGEVLHANRPHRLLEAGQLFLLDAGAECGNSYATDITRAWPVDGTFTDTQARLYDIVLESQKQAIAQCRPGVPYGDVHRAACLEIIAGLKDFGLLKGSVEDIYEQDAHALFFPHGVGHLIGLDVHDMEDLGEDRVGYGTDWKRQSDKLGRRYLRLRRRMDQGFVVTIEPGLYFIEAYLNDAAMEARFKDFVDFDKARSLLGFGGIRIEDNIHITAEGPENLSQAIPKNRDEVEALVGTKSDWAELLHTV